MKRYTKCIFDEMAYYDRKPKKYLAYSGKVDKHGKPLPDIDKSLARLDDPEVIASLVPDDLKISAYLDKGDGKMKGMYGVSTDAGSIGFCKKMAGDRKKICSMCYSLKKMKGFKKKSRPAWKSNLKIFSKRIVPVEEWSQLDYVVPYVRIHPNGEVSDYKHYKSICNFIIMQYLTNSVSGTVGWFTKRKDLVAKYGKWNFDKYNVPEDFLQMTYSNWYFNKEATTGDIPTGFDRIFNVFEKDFAEENGIEINCGTKGECARCRECYKSSGWKVVNEQLKSGSKKI